MTSPKELPYSEEEVNNILLNDEEVNNILLNDEEVNNILLNDEEVNNILLNDEEAEFERFYSKMSLTEETTCGFWIFKGNQLQKFANKKVLVLLFGLAGCCFSSTFSYFNGTITTMEKRFKFSSKATGVILVGNDITKLILTIVINYYASRGHRPRWIAFGLYCVAAFCFLNTLPHLIYGSGTDALHLTLEYGGNTSYYVDNSSQSQQNKMLCVDKGEEKCELEEGNIIPPIILFVSQLIGGVGGCLYYSLGFSYLDDNIQKTKSPAIISFTYFVRMLGPALGYGIVSICLKLFISPQLTPTINNSDPRWLGAWWLGWLILGGTLIVFTTVLCMFPNNLPRAVARREFKKQKSKDVQVKPEASLNDMMTTLKRLMSNRLYIYIQMSNIFAVFGFNPFWVYLPKYIEIQYKKSASTASLVTGTVGLVFAALGILLGGVLLQKFKPKARYMTIWNAIINTTFVVGVISYSLLGCPAADSQIPIFENGELNTNLACNENCKCDYVKFSPVCSVDKSQTFISACHAGCTQKTSLNDGNVVYTNCSCISPTNYPTPMEINDITGGGIAYSGPCAVDCDFHFTLFLIVVCFLKLTGSMGRVTSFLVSIRCVEEHDKTVSLAITMAAISIFSLIPSPIFFGFLMDSTCLIWGKTCTGKGNCWFYNAALLRTRVTYAAAGFLACGVFFDILTFKNIRDLNIFDDEFKMESIKKDTNIQNEKSIGNSIKE